MADIRIRVSLLNGDEAKANLVSLGEAGDAAAKKVEDSFKTTAQAATQAAQQMNVTERAAQQMGISLDQLAAAANGDAAAMRTLAQATNQVAASQEQAAAAATRFSAPAVTGFRQMQEAMQSMTRSAAPAVTGFRQLEQSLEPVVRMAAPAVTGYRQMAIAQEAAATSAGLHGLQLGRLNMEVGTAAGRFLGLNTGLTRFGSMLGGAVVGYGEVIAVVGAITLLAAAYEKLTEGERKAKEEQERLNKVTEDFINKQGRPAGDIGAAVQNEQDTINRLTSQLATVQKTGSTPGSFIAGGPDPKKVAELNQQLAIHAARLRDLQVEQDRLTRESKEAVTQAQLEVDHQNALNDAFGKGSVVIARINADYELRSKLLKNAAEYTGVERVNMDAAAKAMHDAAIAAAENAGGIGELRSKTAELNVALPVLTAGLYDLQPTLMRVNSLWVDQLHNVQVLKDLYPEIVKQIRAIGDANEKVTKEQVNDAADAIKKAQKYSEDISKIWRDGIGKLTTDGFKSFLDFAQDLEQLFTRLMDRMAQRARELGKEAGGAGYAALGYGSIALSGGLAGYQIGQSSPSATSGAVNGALGGAVTGAALGSAIAPGIGTAIGAFVGGISGLIGGLIGGGAAARDRAKAEEQLRRSLEQSLVSIKVQMGQMTELEGQTEDAHLQFAQRAQQINDAYSGKKNEAEREALLSANSKLEQEYIEWLKKQDEATKAATKAAEEAAAAQQALADAQKNLSAQGNYQLRFLNATGKSDEAFALQQQLEMDQAIAEGLDGVQVVARDRPVFPALAAAAVGRGARSAQHAVPGGARRRPGRGGSVQRRRAVVPRCLSQVQRERRGLRARLQLGQRDDRQADGGIRPANDGRAEASQSAAAAARRPQVDRHEHDSHRATATHADRADAGSGRRLRTAAGSDSGGERGDLGGRI
jgi:hypothetical protein